MIIAPHALALGTSRRGVAWRGGRFRNSRIGEARRWAAAVTIRTARNHRRALARFPSLKARQLLRVLTSKPLGYHVVRKSGSHRRMEARGRPPITFSFHDRQTIRPATVKRVLCDQVGLDETEALRLL